MKFVGEGVCDSSVHHFVHPSAFAQEQLCFLQSVGRFDVTASYKVNRFNFNSYLIIAVHRGSLRCHVGEEAATASSGEVLLLNCHKPHTYYALSACSFAFLHFGGAAIEPLYQYIHACCGLMIAPKVFERFSQTIAGFTDALEQGRTLSETEISAALYQLLMLLISSAGTHPFSGEDRQAILGVTEYILQHLSDRLTVEELARRCGYSTGCFSRMFKSVTGFAPYRYILHARLDFSKHLLSSTFLPIQEIADRSGFTTLANFSYAFRRSTGISPSEYRSHPV